MNTINNSFSNIKHFASRADIVFPALLFCMLIPGAKSPTKLLLLICTANAIRYLRQNPQFTKLLGGALALISYVAISTTWSQTPLAEPALKYVGWCLYTLAFCSSALWYASNVSTPYSLIGRVLTVGILGNLMVTLYHEPMLFEQTRVGLSGILNNQIHFGSVIVITITLLSFGFWKERLVFMATTGALFLLLALSGSRAPMAISLIPAGIIFFRASTRAKLALILSASAVIILLSSNHSFGSLSARGMSNRDVIAKTSIKYAIQRPVFGHGYLNCFSCSPVGKALKTQIKEKIRHPHSLLVSAFYYGGITGLLLTIGLLLSTLYFAIKQRSSESLILILMTIGLTLTGTNHIVSALTAATLIIWLPIGLTFGRVAFLRGEELPSPTNTPAPPQVMES